MPTAPAESLVLPDAAADTRPEPGAEPRLEPRLETRPEPCPDPRDAPGHDARRGQVQYTRTRIQPVASQLLREQRISGGLERSELANAFKLLRTQVLQRLTQLGANTLGITSPGDGEGKTVAAINLAVHISMEIDWTVLLVDADLHAPSVHRILGLEVKAGLSDYLAGRARVEDLLIHPGFGRFVILPGHDAMENSSEMLSSVRMLELVSELKARYPKRMVIFDLPPLLSSSDTLAFSPFAEAFLMVVEEGRTRQEDVVRAAQMLDSSKLLGTVLNKARDISVGRGPGPTGDEPRGGWVRRLLRRRSGRA